MRHQELIFEAVQLSLVAIFSTVGILINLFIARLHVTDWFKGRQIKVSDKIICCLAMSRMGFLCFSVLHMFLYMFAPRIGHFIASLGLSFTNFTNLWILTLLSYFHFFTVVNYKNPLFVRLKTLILQKVKRFIMGAILISLCNAPLVVWKAGIVDRFDNEATRNITTAMTNVDIEFYIIYFMGNCAPFIMYSAPSILLVVSLYHHLRYMRNSDAGFTENHLGAYYVAIKSTAICFLIYALHVLTIIFSFVFYKPSIIFALHILFSILPPLHSCYLIYRTPRLRQTFTNLFQKKSSCFSCNIGTNSERTIETVAK